MKNLVIILLITYFFNFGFVYAEDYIYILNDKCINDLYFDAQTYFRDSKIRTLRDPRGIILRYEFENVDVEYNNVSTDVYKQIEYFLAKIENPAIIEVHTEKFYDKKLLNLKNWEVSTVIANRIEAMITVPVGTVSGNRIHSVGYGEFLPAKNTSNNGGKYSNRVDIIILCNINGE